MRPLPGAAPAALAARERLLRALRRAPLDRPPVICPGGMMTMAIASAMRASGAAWPAAHGDARAMADLTLATREQTGLESLAVPFCMTVEAEALGCQVDLGGELIAPHVAAEAPEPLRAFDPCHSGRAPVVLEAVRILAAMRTGYPVMAAVTGPVSLAAMVVDAGGFLRRARRDSEGAHRLVSRAAHAALDFALAQAEAGADCVTIAEPTATGDILGAHHFERLAAPALADLLGALRARGVPAILHVCGDLRPLIAQLRQLAARAGEFALSVDAMVGGALLRRELPQCVRVGNLDALLLERGPTGAISRAGRKAAREFEVVAPACGLVPATPAAHLRALVESVQRGEASQAH